MIVVATGGDIDGWRGCGFNLGDLYVLTACALYAGYTLGLRRRPAIAGFSLFIGFAVVALARLRPAAGVGDLRRALLLADAPRLADPRLYHASAPRFLSQIFYIRGVELIGPARAGLFINLIPVFGALMAVLLLGEPFGWSEVVSAALVFGGIAMAEGGRAGARGLAEAYAYSVYLVQHEDRRSTREGQDQSHERAACRSPLGRIIIENAGTVLADVRFDYGEERFVAFGHVEGRLSSAFSPFAATRRASSQCGRPMIER